MSDDQGRTQRIDHISIGVWPENLESATQTFAELLDIKLEGPFVSAKSGLTFYIDWDSGIEVVAPTDKDAAGELVRFLEEKGEGVFRVVLGVPDQAGSLERARSLGYKTALSSDVFKINPAWRDRYTQIDEALMHGEVHGVRLVFGQIERRQ
jgi:hypothetical protein